VLLAFLLVLTINGVTHDAGGDVLFNSVITCNQYAKWLEQGGNERWTTSRVYHQNKIEAYCVPKFVDPSKITVHE